MTQDSFALEVEGSPLTENDLEGVREGVPQCHTLRVSLDGCDRGPFL